MSSEYPVHPYAELFPMLSADDLARLAQDIKANGQHAKVIVDQQGRLVDGRNRLAACRVAGVRPLVETREFPDEAAVLAYIASANLHRRHLSESQRAMIAAKVANMRKGGDGSNQYKQGANPPIGGLAVSQAEAAEKMNVGRRTVQRATKVIQSGTPELQEAVKEGEITLNAAAKIAELPSDEQAEAMDAHEQKTKAKPKGKPEKNGREEQELDEADAKRKRLAHEKAHEAINSLSRIPRTSSFRESAFRMVTDWIKQERKCSK